MVNRLKDRVAIVTGAGRGIGRGEALFLAEEGALVVVNDFDGAAADEVVREIVDAGGQAVANHGSVSSSRNGEDMVKLAIETFGGLHILVNNAGFTRDRRFFNLTEDDWDQIMDVHLRGLYCATRAASLFWKQAYKELGDQPVYARVINTSSGSGLFGNEGQVNYSAAKAGIAVATAVLAIELARFGVLVNAIAPNARTGLTEATPGLAEVVREPEEGQFDVWHPDNVAPLVAWLAGEQCQFSGGVFFQLGGLVGLCEGWRVVSRESTDSTRLTLEGLDESMPRLIAGRESKTPLSQGDAMGALITDYMSTVGSGAPA